MRIADARELWSPAGVYLQHRQLRPAAAAGVDALQAALADWRGGRTSWEHWGESTEARPGRVRAAGRRRRRSASRSAPRCRSSSGSVATALPDGARVLVPDVEFTSTLFPFLVQASAARRAHGPVRRPARRRGRRRRRRRRLQRRADEHRRGRRPRRDPRRGAGGTAPLTLLDATQAVRLAAARRRALRRGRRAAPTSG